MTARVAVIGRLPHLALHTAVLEPGRREAGRSELVRDDHASRPPVVDDEDEVDQRSKALEVAGQ
jgi:hypothetical protein